MPSYQLDPGAGSPPSEPGSPARLGRYELLGQLATGGMAEIHLARLAGEAGFEKIVVVKRLLPELVASPSYVTMFLDEGKLVARLDHPNVCEVHELGRDGAEYYLAMPYLDGVSVHELIARPRDPDRIGELRIAAGVIVQACAGLHHAHELRDADGSPAGLVHRDVSPSNLFVTAAGVVKVLDFGIAKVRGAAETEVGTIKGKQQYMAPEQLLGEPLDRRCDVFALGIVLFELATHQRLFKRASDYLAARAVLEEPTPRAETVDPAVPVAFADVIARALARDPAQRFADAPALARALEAAIAPHGGIAGPSEIAAAVTSTDELTAQRTRQARVLGEARSHDHLVRTRGSAERASRVATSPRELVAPTRALRPAIPPPLADATRADTELMRTPDTAVHMPRRRAPLRVAGAIAAVIAAAAAIGFAIVMAIWSGDEAPPRTPVASMAPDATAAPDPVVRADAGAIPTDAAGVDSAATAATTEQPTEQPTNHARARRKPGLLSIDSTPYATIYVDGSSLGVTPIVRRTLPAGRHKLRAVLQDGRVKHLTIDVPDGKLAPPINLTSW